MLINIVTLERLHAIIVTAAQICIPLNWRVYKKYKREKLAHLHMRSPCIYAWSHLLVTFRRVAMPGYMRVVMSWILCQGLPLPSSTALVKESCQDVCSCLTKLTSSVLREGQVSALAPTSLFLSFLTCTMHAHHNWQQWLARAKGVLGAARMSYKDTAQLKSTKAEIESRGESHAELVL